MSKTPRTYYTQNSKKSKYGSRYPFVRDEWLIANLHYFPVSACTIEYTRTRM